jgi:hypothetical protein
MVTGQPSFNKDLKIQVVYEDSSKEPRKPVHELLAPRQEISA